MRAVSIGLAAASLVAACVGDSTQPPGDGGGQDGTTSDANPVVDSSNDTTTTTDGGADTGPVSCNADGTFGNPVEVTELDDTASTNFGARLTADELTAYLSRNDLDAGDMRTAQLFVASRATKTAVFGSPKTAFKTNPGATYPTLAPDESTLAYELTHMTSVVVEGDIYASSRSDAGVLGTGAAVTGLSQGKFNEIAPYFASDGAIWLQVYLSLDGGAPVARIQRSPKITTTSYGPREDQALGTPAAKNDFNPVLSADGLRLYFSSDRSTVDTNIFVAKRATTSDPWGTPTAVPELNAANTADAPTWISPDNCTIYTQRGTPSKIFRATR